MIIDQIKTRILKLNMINYALQDQMSIKIFRPRPIREKMQNFCFYPFYNTIESRDIINLYSIGDETRKTEFFIAIDIPRAHRQTSFCWNVLAQRSCTVHCAIVCALHRGMVNFP